MFLKMFPKMMFSKNSYLQIFLLTCLALTTGLLVPANAADIKIGVVDADRLLDETKYGERAIQEYKKELAIARAVMIKKQKRVGILKDSLSIAYRVKDKKSVIKEHEQKLTKNIEEYKIMEQALTKRLYEKDKEVANKLRKKVQKIIDQFMKKEGYCLILEKNKTVATCDSIDITDAIIKILNRQVKIESKKKKD